MNMTASMGYILNHAVNYGFEEPLLGEKVIREVLFKGLSNEHRRWSHMAHFVNWENLEMIDLLLNWFYSIKNTMKAAIECESSAVLKYLQMRNPSLFEEHRVYFRASNKYSEIDNLVSDPNLKN